MVKIKELVKEVKSLKREIKKSHLYRKRIYTIKESAFVIGVSLSYMQKLVGSKQLPHSKPSGKLIFIKRRDLENFILSNPIKTNDEVDTLVSNTLINLKN
ncbi:helix-turn-helix domain-containing protein [Flavicella sediminum]|uniref:helix-turn-helix domain-containing protein n=1 Tax=Flavicella sediminum TaxID=2585141 RepID=UPI00112386DD|nr:helix-turn-helix domain-containing protein [Flavicella sediminum]